jgi:hypothetical protein
MTVADPSMAKRGRLIDSPERCPPRRNRRERVRRSETHRRAPATTRPHARSSACRCPANEPATNRHKQQPGRHQRSLLSWNGPGRSMDAAQASACSGRRSTGPRRLAGRRPGQPAEQRLARAHSAISRHCGSRRCPRPYLWFGTNPGTSPAPAATRARRAVSFRRSSVGSTDRVNRDCCR